MLGVASTESLAVAKKANKPKVDTAPITDAPFERVEFQAPIGFTARLDRARKRRGLSRSAYVRQAVLLLLAQDEEK